MDSDRPIKRQEDDRLGFGPVAEQLARVIAHQSVKDGFVLGIEGKWGSGKSTLVNLTIDALRRNSDSPPEIIEFSPWLVGNRDELLQRLFDELATAAVRIDPIDDLATSDDDKSKPGKKRASKHSQLQRKEELKERLGKQLESFGYLATGLAKVAKVAGAAGVPFAESVGTVLERSSEAASGVFTPISIAKRKSEIVDALKLLSRRIVVFVDDLDRLEPGEATEMLRLVKAVADFPNVVYVLSYDPEIIRETLRAALLTNDGVSFLKKIVQVSFRVPRPEAFDLRRWFQSEVYALFSAELSGAVDRQKPMRERVAYAIDVQGGRYLNTPRDVVRALNALRLHAIPVRSKIDIADMVWLQLVRMGNSALYSWVEEYLTEVSAIHGGAAVGESGGREMFVRLEQALSNDKVDIPRTIIELAQLLPGIDPGVGFKKKPEERRVLKDLHGDAVNRFVASRRLGSPQHYRFYFAFAEPAGALRDEQVQAFIELADGQPSEAVKMLSGLASEGRPQGGVMAEVLIDRLIATAEHVPASAVPAIFTAFATVLDDIANSTSDGVGEYRAWDSAERAVQHLLKQVPQRHREACLRQLFAGPALGWLASVLRGEIFSHGLYGNQATPESQWLLTDSEFKAVLAKMLKRFGETPPEELMRVPNLMSLLYGWMQGGGGDDARRWVKAQTETDEGLLTFLSRVRGWGVSSNIGVYYTLKRQDLQKFLDYDDVVRRVRRNARRSAAESDRSLAAELLVAFKQGEAH